MAISREDYSSRAYDCLWKDCKATVLKLECGTCDRIAEGFGEISAPCVRICLPDQIEILTIASEGYPGTPPIILLTLDSGATEQIHLEWDVTTPVESRLASALSHHFVPPGPFRRVYGPSTSLPLTQDSAKAEAAGWRPFFSGSPLESEGVGASLFQRSNGILDRALRHRSVFIIGLGSGGSYVATQLARVGVGHLYILDPEVVEASNLARTTYSVADIGIHKAPALAKQLLNINPEIQVFPYVCEVADLGALELKRIICECDLILPLTDDPKAQGILNHFCYHLGKSAIFASIYRGARGGEVILSIPEVTPCYQCSTQNRRNVGENDGESVDVEVDYGTQRLVGEVALGADIQHIDSATVKIALSLLLRDCSDASVAKFVSGALDLGFTFLVISTTPNYWNFPLIFGDTPGQYGYQSAWLSPEKNERCTVCGASENRLNPADFPLRRLGREAANSQ